MAVLGSVITLDTLSRLRRYYEDLIIWLDPDKQKEMIKFSQLAQLLGFKVKTIFSDKDPKEHTDDYIMQQLSNW